MKRSCCVWIVACLLICFSGVVKGQVIKLENGVAFTKLKGYGKSMMPYQVSLGIDYLDRSWFNLSSQAGYIRKGSKEKIGIYNEAESIPHDYVYNKVGADYITLNTTFQLKKESGNETYYVGIGPRVDFKIDDLSPVINTENPLKSFFKSESVLYGLKCEAGFKYTANRLQMGINFSYLPSFNKQIDVGEDFSLRDQTFTLGLSVGYVLN